MNFKNSDAIHVARHDDQEEVRLFFAQLLKDSSQDRFFTRVVASANHHPGTRRDRKFLEQSRHINRRLFSDDRAIELQISHLAGRCIFGRK
jgi:hypothetical protein